MTLECSPFDELDLFRSIGFAKSLSDAISVFRVFLQTRQMGIRRSHSRPFKCRGEWAIGETGGIFQRNAGIGAGDDEALFLCLPICDIIKIEPVMLE